MNAATPVEPWCSAHVTEVPPCGMDGNATIKCEVQGHPDQGGAYYWTPAQARAIFIALRCARDTWDGPPVAGMPIAAQIAAQKETA